MQNTFILFMKNTHVNSRNAVPVLNGKEMGQLPAFTTEVPCMYASREDKERTWRRLIMKKKELKHLNRGHSCWEKPIKAVVSLDPVA